jgi:hypothetical protein
VCLFFVVCYNKLCGWCGLNRKANTLQGRQYHVSGPRALWHIDGNHKLIKYGLVIHGGIWFQQSSCVHEVLRQQ